VCGDSGSKLLAGEERELEDGRRPGAVGSGGPVAVLGGDEVLPVELSRRVSSASCSAEVCEISAYEFSSC
jgi:hypothetical protein